MMRSRIEITAILTLASVLQSSGCGPQQKSNPAPQVTATAPGESVRELPIDVIEDKHSESLRCWHLYETTNASATVGDAITFIGQYRPESNYIAILQPPWITVAFAPGKDRGGERPDTFQAFVLRPQIPPPGLDADGYARFKGVIKVNQPDLSTNYKYQHDIPVFIIDLTDTKAIRLAQGLEKLQQACPAIVQQAEPRLRKLCEQYKLQYAFDSSTLSASWFHGCIAFTTPVTTHPRFSFKPVPYATVSVLFIPETGKPAGLIFHRRVWQDPHD